MSLLNEKRDRENWGEFEKQMKRRPCSGPFKYKFIAYDGDATVCCLDTKKELVIGNLSENTLEEIWDNERAHKIRMAHILGKLEDYPVCKRCPNLDSPQLSDDEIIDYLKSAGENELAEKWIIEKEKSWDKEFINKRILIELTDNCNLNCAMCCNRSLPHGVSKGFMDFSLYSRILNEVDLDKAWSIELFWLGESLLHPEFNNILEYTYSKVKDTSSHVNIHTNASLLDFKKARLILKFKDKFPWITFSVDAINQETYSKIRGGNLSAVYKNIENFILLKKKLGLKFPNINLQFIVMDENASEAKAFLDYWINFYKKNKIRSKDFIYFKRIELHEIEKQERANVLFDEVIERDNLFTRYNDVLSIRSKDKAENGVYWFEEEKPKRRLCAAPFKNPIIRWDGEMTVCCLDDIFLYSIGNLCDNSFSEIWHGKRMDDFRRKHIKGKYNEMLTKEGRAKCKACIGYFFPTISDDEIKRYKEIKRIR